MLPLSRFESILKSDNPGYASVYMFDENAAKTIIESKSSAGMSRFPVLTDTLVMDLDNGPDQLKAAQDKLKALGLYHKVWSSGSKGFHVVLRHPETLYGSNVPYSQRVWVEALDVGADLSLYQHGRILSLPGRIHPKTGNRKVAVETVPGDELTISLLNPPGPVFTVGENGGLSELEAGLWTALQALASEPLPGNRHTRLWSTAQHFADAGVGFEATLDLMLRINETWEMQKDPSEVELAVSQAYRRNLSPPITKRQP